MESRFEAYFREQRERHLAELDQFLRIPSMSGAPDHRSDVRRAAEWVAGQLRAAGVGTVRLMETDGHPVVYGECVGAPGTPVLLVYGHYDVQPPDPVEKWESPPFEPSVRGGRLYARGVSDDKAPLIIALKALEALHALDGRLPIHMKFLFEGEEEVGSPNLRPFVEAHTDMLAADLVVSDDGAMWRPTEPSLTTGGKGLCGLEIHLHTARADLHSGRHGGGVPNALHAMVELIAGLHDAEGRVAVPEFYDEVGPLTEAERAQIAALPFDEDAYRRDLDLEALVGEPGWSTLERQWARPTLDVNGLWGGFTGPGEKTVIPCEAHSKITCRLVANQRPSKILDLLERHIRRSAPRGAQVTVDRFPGCGAPLPHARRSAGPEGSGTGAGAL